MKVNSTMVAIILVLCWIQGSKAQSIAPPGVEEWSCIDESNPPTSIGNQDHLTLGVILIQFADWETNLSARGGYGGIDNITGDTIWYRYQDYGNMLSRRDFYITPNPADPQSQPRSPQGEPVYGSMTDYYDEVSYGKFSLTVEIVNDMKIVDGDTLVDWLTADHDKNYYDDFGGHAL